MFATTNDTNNNKNDDDHATRVQQTQNQLKAIENEIKSTQALTSNKMDILALKALYKDANSQYFERGVDVLANRYSSIRTTRGDGNCYYRSFLYQLSDLLLANKNGDEMKRVVAYVKDSNTAVTNIGGYDEMTMEIFYDSMVEFIETLEKAETTSETMHTELNQENATSDYCTWYMRVITATYLKADPDRFLPYLEDGYMDIAAFCQTQIEPMGKECSMVQVLALAEAFQVRVTIEYLDGHEFKDQLTKHEFGPESSQTHLYMLYRPGHYDILYPKE